MKMPFANAPMRLFWFATGLIALGLGAVGAILPLLPTTPFVILAAFAFGKSSPALQKRLEESAFFGPIILDWRANGAIAPRYKAIAVSMMAAAFILSIIMQVGTTILAVQAVVLMAAAAFILTRPSGPKVQKAPQDGPPSP
ncbi:YbaN family protein [Rhizobium sp. L1K21]|uniref:YbaN family protein n=1 Tax=Rhizobium sp. L1K21 TaxID=2954933 RepID=UPI002092046C|nr:YbaN family protein [Rhizobium sp. L1K21]MCO6185552.1 YbaN family protein [Rhizobium sp. L1K21]